MLVSENSVMCYLLSSQGWMAEHGQLPGGWHTPERGVETLSSSDSDSLASTLPPARRGDTLYDAVNESL